MGDEPAPAIPALAFTWGLSDCRYTIAVALVAPAAVQEILPEGFRPRDGPGGQAEVHFDAYECATGTWLDGKDLAEVPYGSVYVPVEPPAQLREVGYDAYFVKFDFLAPKDAVERFERWGLPAHAGRAEVDVTRTPTGGAAVASAAVLGDIEFRLAGISNAPTAQTAPLPFVEHTPLASGGLARWHARLHNATFSTGAGTLEVSGWPRDLLGADTLPVTFSTGRWNLDEADVTVPEA